MTTTNSLGRLMAAVVAAGALSLSADGAAAQSGQIYQSMGASDVSSIFAELNIATEMRPSSTPGGTPVMLATTPGGAKFLVVFLQCADPSRAAGCRQTTISTAQAGANLAYDDLNRFNGGSSVTTVVYDSSNEILIFGRNVFAPGGVGRENYKLQTLLFLNDMASFSSNRSRSATAVSLSRAPSLDGRLADKGLSEAAHERAHAGLEVEIAISNAGGVDFSIED